MIANNCTVIEKDLRQIADMLLQNQIHVNRPVDYEKGIAGIGVGIDYLVRNDFLDVEDDIFEDFDQNMFVGFLRVLKKIIAYS